jgi:hypothetical protein
MPQQHQNPLNIEQFQNGAMAIVQGFCSIFSMPLDLILRFKAGSRYHNPSTMFFASGLMLVMPMIEDTLSSFNSPIFMAARIQRPHALFDIGSLSKLFFVLCLIAGFRTYKRMWKPELEEHSRFEGPPLPFFEWLPGGRSFWLVRLAYEPAAVLIAAMILQSLLIFTPGLAHFLQFGALCLAMKNFITFYRNWEFLRNTLDIAHMGPILAKFVENSASTEELNSVHLASLPKDISPELRRSTAVHIARVISPGIAIPEAKGDFNANN